MSDAARRRIEALALLLLALLGVGALMLSLRLGLGGEETPGPGLFPAMAAALLLALVVPLAFALLRPVGGQEPAEEIDADGGRRLGLYLLAMAVAALTLVPLGFALGIGIALVVVLRFAEGLGWARSVTVSALGIAACFILFDRLLEVPLPRGTFWPG
jgi:putative tricarboxylic transport membrane protein